MTLQFTSGQALTAAQLNALVPASAVKLADNAPVNNSTTFVNDGDLFVPLTASATYEMRAEIRYSSNNTANIKFGWTFPSGTTAKLVETIYDTAGTFSMFPIVQTDVAACRGTAGIAIFTGLIFVSSTAGNWQLQFAQNTANASNTFTQAGSYIRLTQLS